MAGVVGLAALAYRAQHELFGLTRTAGDRLPYQWAAVLALVVPALATALVPRRIGVALLAGWIAGGTALFLRFYLWLPPTERGIKLVFAATLAGLLILAVSLGRLTQPARQSRRARSPSPL